MYTYEIINQFKTAMTDAGIDPPIAIIGDGNLHRFHVEGDKSGTKNGWYVLHLDGRPAGSFGHWRQKINETWHLESNSKSLNPAEKRAFAIELQRLKMERQTEETKRHDVAIKKAAYIWGRSTPVKQHQYTTKKGVKPYSARCYRGVLVIPVYDRTGGLVSLQFIGDDGTKRLLKGGKMQGSWCSIGKLIPGGMILICEGWATGASLYEATGYFVLIAFSAANLTAVAKLARQHHQDSKIIICADNDEKTAGNPGLTYATQAALEVDARLAIPPIAGDFNDYENMLRESVQ